MNQSRVRPLSPQFSYFFGHSPFPYRGPRPGPLCGSFWSTLFHVLHDGWDISSLYSSVRCEKTKKNKKPCRSAKTKLTCDLWYQARSKAGMTGGEANWPCQIPPTWKYRLRCILTLFTMPQFVSISSKRTPLWRHRSLKIGQKAACCWQLPPDL